MKTERDFLDSTWVEGLAKSFIAYCDRMNIEYPRDQWDLEKIYFLDWIALIKMKPFPLDAAKNLLKRMKNAKGFGSNFDSAISQVSQWIDTHSPDSLK